MRRAVYPGSFDPITFGHVDLVRRAAVMFDEVVVAVADNPNKKVLFTHDERRDMAVDALKDIPNSRVIVFRGLLANLVEQQDCCAIIRGMRVFLVPSLRYVYLSSNTIKEVAKHDGKIDDLVPEIVLKHLREKFGHNK